MTENQTDGSDKKKLDNSEAVAMWQYHSDRADQSATAIRAVLFAAANGAILLTLDRLAPKFEKHIDYVILILAALAISCFAISAYLGLKSWRLQQTKAMNRRSLTADYAQDPSIVLALEALMDARSMNGAHNRIEKKRKEWERQNRLNTRDLDKKSTLILVFGLTNLIGIIMIQQLHMLLSAPM